MLKELGIHEDLIQLADKIDASLEPIFKKYEDICSYNQLKVLTAMQEERLSNMHFNWHTGYGYDDPGREKIEAIFARIFKTEDAIVRPTIVNGTHALTLCLTGLLRPGDELLAISGKPYDTLDEVIGITNKYNQSLKDIGVTYQQVDLLENGKFDVQSILNKIHEKTKMVYIQRSTGYGWRPALTIEMIEEIIAIVKAKKSDVIVMIDNCYGEFMDYKEPTEVGADIMAGSLIKNPGGGFAIAGGYIVGRSDLVEAVSYRMTSPGIGKECGLMFGQSRLMFQGLFVAPQTVLSAVKSAIFCSKLFEQSGYEVCPKPEDSRSDIIQSVKLLKEEKVLRFCEGVQAAAPVDAHVTPVPWAMPGYDSEVIMAAGAFVQGSSIELSADAPIREPFIVYFQGGLTYEHGKFGALKALNAIESIK
ncbi:MAG: aminotransferase class V-fold PLP-dependent enzyme [Clostridia bacterium]|nr:aminotransferase class V-fold PLP-dependent enzyme [Clostridia bacterium]